MVTANDGVLTTTQSFTFSVNDSAPNVPTINPITIAPGGTIPAFNVNATGNSTLSYSVSVGGENPLYDIQVQYGLNQPAFGFNFNKKNEWYYLSANGSNAVNGGYYVLMPNDMLYAWNGSIGSTITQSAVFNFTPYSNVYQNPALLSSAVYPAIPTVLAANDYLYSIQQRFGLNTPDFGYNYHGDKEVYFLSSNGSNAAGGGYYVLMPTGLLYAWDGKTLATTIADAPVADLSAWGVYADPALLYADSGQVQAVTANVNSAGQVVITQNANFVGTVRVTARVSDGAEFTLRSFLVTVT